MFFTFFAIFGSFGQILIEIRKDGRTDRETRLKRCKDAFKKPFGWLHVFICTSMPA